MSKGGDDIFNRWSQRRRAVAAEAETPLPEETPADPMPVEPEQTEAEILEEMGLTDPDALEMGDDFSGFMREGVPAALRQRALRKLWRLNPMLANVDGLVDYGDDFTDAALVIPDMKTAYRVGKGMLKDILEEPPEEVIEDGEADAMALAEEDTPEVEVEAELAPEDEDEGAEEADTTSLDAPEEAPPMPAPRRMAFRFED